MTQTFPLRQKLRSEGGGKWVLSHPARDGWEAELGCGKKVWEQPECVCISWVIDDMGSRLSSHDRCRNVSANQGGKQSRGRQGTTHPQPCSAATV